MFKFLFIVALAMNFGFTVSSIAHTSLPDSVICPLDGTVIEISVTMSMTTFGNYKDFQKKGAIGDYYSTLINECPTCHYAGYKDDFDSAHFTSKEKLQLLSMLKVFNGVKIDDAMRCFVAAEISKFLHKSSEKIAWEYLLGSYLLRKDASQTRRKQYQDSARIYLIKGIDLNEIVSENLAPAEYLIGELFRRVGNFEQATLYYDKTLSNPSSKQWLQDMAKEQKEMALKKDDNNDM